MADDKKTVTVKATQWHTHKGEAHDVGDVYEIDADLVDTIVAQGKATVVDAPTPHTSHE